VGKIKNTEESAMSVGLLVVCLLYRFYVFCHLSKWFTFFLFKFVFVCCVVSFYALLVTVDGMVSCGITRQFPISLLRLFLRATNPRKPLKPACTIPFVVRSYIILFHISSNQSNYQVNNQYP